MSTLTFKNGRGELVDISTVAAMKVRNNFGAILKKAGHDGAVAITWHNTLKAVLLSCEEFESLVQTRSRTAANVNVEFDRLLARMQTPKAKRLWKPRLILRPGTSGALPSRPRARCAKPVE